jgi:hypothetical protein
MADPIRARRDDPIRARLDDYDYATMPEYADLCDALRAVLDLCDRSDDWDEMTGWVNADRLRRWIAEHLGVTDVTRNQWCAVPGHEGCVVRGDGKLVHGPAAGCTCGEGQDDGCPRCADLAAMHLTGCPDPYHAGCPERGQGVTDGR